MFGGVATFELFLEAGLVLSPLAEGALYLVDLAPGTDREEVKAALLDQGALRISVYEEELARMASLPFARFVFGFVEVELLFVVVILAAGLGFLTYAAAVGRDIEFAAVAARGASRWQTAGLLAGESLAIGLVGLTIGVGIGLLLALSTIPLFQPSTTALVPFFPEVPLQFLFFPGIAALTLFSAAVLGALRLAMMDMGKVLKRRIG